MAADNGFNEGRKAYARLLETGQGVEKNLTEAAKYYRIAGAWNSVSRCALLYLTGTKGVEKNLEKAKELSKTVADEGLPSGMIAYAHCLMSEKDYTGAINYYKMAADFNLNDSVPSSIRLAISQAQNILGYILVNPEKFVETSKDDIQALLQLLPDDSQLPHTLSITDARIRLALNKAGVEYYKKAADQGDPNGLYNYGLILEQGLYGTPQDIGKANECFKQAAEGGHMIAQNKYGIYLLNKSEGLEIEDEKTVLKTEGRAFMYKFNESLLKRKEDDLLGQRTKIESLIQKIAEEDLTDEQKEKNTKKINKHLAAQAQEFTLLLKSIHHYDPVFNKVINKKEERGVLVER
jgi:TPR repeat protein